ncbi:MAG: signal recognition particle-docking protein FtsY [Pseudanabaenaceae cyanobacterium]|jgi:fused signal recognition particle receptor
MVFNWFRRQFDGKDTSSNNDSSSPLSNTEAKDTSTPAPNPEPEEASTADPAESQTDNPEATSPETTSREVTAPVAPNVSPELLSWAKAAYVNIQKQELATPDPSPDTSGESSAESSAESEDIATPELTPELTTEPTPAASTPSPEATIEPVVDVVPDLPAVSQSTASQSTESILENTSPAISEPSPIPAAPIAEVPPTASPTAPPTVAPTPEPDIPFWMQNADREARIANLEATAIIDDVPPPVSTTPKPRKPTITFDDTFLWSAEVLAAQGRKPEDISVEEISWLNRLQQGLGKTRIGLVNQLKSLVGQGPLSPEAVDEIEMLLLQADVGVKATDAIIGQLQDKLRRDILPPEQAIAYLKDLLRQMLDTPLAATDKQPAKPEMLIPDKNQLNIWLITGVNGAGKTTTIGKLTHLAVKSGYKTLIAAADTFRAAAVEQVKTWGDRSEVEVIANLTKNADPAAVVFDALAAAESRGTELLLVDTAGRLQNKQNLMDELAKIRRIIDKKNKNAKIESLLVLDATLGQNGLKQAEIFTKAAGITGVILTKLDGTAKGGVAFGVVQQLNLPIRFIGAGEGIEDLRPFSSYEFVEALLR